MAILYPKFLHNAFEYRAARLEWIDLWKHVDAGPGWEFRLPPNTASRNPIFSVISPVEGKAVQVVQVDPTNEPAFMLGAWIAPVRDPKSGITFEQLVIVCILEDAALQRSHELIRNWVHEGIRPSRSFERLPPCLLRESPVLLSRGMSRQ